MTVFVIVMAPLFPIWVLSIPSTVSFGRCPSTSTVSAIAPLSPSQLLLRCSFVMPRKCGERDKQLPSAVIPVWSSGHRLIPSCFRLDRCVDLSKEFMRLTKPWVWEALPMVKHLKLFMWGCSINSQSALTPVVSMLFEQIEIRLRLVMCVADFSAPSRMSVCLWLRISGLWL